MARSIAEKLADALGSVVLDGLVTKRDLNEGFGRSDNRLRETELNLRKDMKDLELRLTLRVGGMIAGSTALTVAILGALVAFK